MERDRGATWDEFVHPAESAARIGGTKTHPSQEPIFTDEFINEIKKQSAEGCLLCRLDDQQEEWD